MNAAQYGADLARRWRREVAGRSPWRITGWRISASPLDARDGDASDGGSNPTGRACYSFCMCPGGQIVPTSTDPAELCVNGMSFSKRSSRWANSGLVSPVAEEDALPFLESPGREPLAGLDFQRHIERQAAIMGGGHLVAPVQTAPDFIAGRLTREEDLPPSSYRPGRQASETRSPVPAENHRGGSRVSVGVRRADSGVRGAHGVASRAGGEDEFARARHAIEDG